MNKGAKILYDRLKKKNLSIGFVCEVGVFSPSESNILGFINDGVTTLLVEADPQYAANIREYFHKQNNVQIVEAAVYDFNGEIELCKRASSTFISQLSSSPALVNDAYKIIDEDKFIAKSIQFSEVDPGNIDLLSIDIEGAEWYVLKYLISKPKIISIETHGKYYTNPFIQEIEKWMQDNGYNIWYKDKSDTVFIKTEIFQAGLLENIAVGWQNLRLKIISIKGQIKNILHL